MTKDEFAKFREITEKTLKITPDNVKTKSLELPMLHNRYRNVYVKERRILNQINTTKTQVYGELYHFYKFDYDYKLDTKREIETYVAGDEKYLKLELQASEQELVVEYLQDLVSLIQRISFNIGHYVEMRKMELGMIT